MLGQELRQAREAAGLSQEQLSFAAKLSRVYISQLERDKKSPTLDTLFQLCPPLGLAASELIARVERARAAAPNVE